MSENVLGIIKVGRTGDSWRDPPTISETLFFTPHRVIVARRFSRESALEEGGLLGLAVSYGVERALRALKGKKKEKDYFELSLEEVLKDNKHNFAISYSEITEVMLKKRRLGAKDYENILRPVFGDKLSVKKMKEV